jgi:hypothetical protein
MAVTLNYPNKHTYCTTPTNTPVLVKAMTYRAKKTLGEYLKEAGLESYITMRCRKSGSRIRLRASYVPADGETIVMSRYT